MIHVRELTKVYHDGGQGPRIALAGITFDALPGEIYGLLGPNGAGKTTLLRIISTVLRPSGGSATINGCDVTTHPAAVRQQIGFVSNNTAIYDRMTAFEVVEYFGRLHDIPQACVEQRIDNIFSRLKMHDIRETLCAKMSTGMRQKVSIARALVHDPPVIIFDEATVGLDVLVARALLEVVADLRDQGKCILFSTHIMREAERLCDRLAIMHEGHVLAEGSQAELLGHYEAPDLEELFFSLISRHETSLSREYGIGRRQSVRGGGLGR
ncbi:MAG TPA: ATP-binding cassette domain-containing protein [Pirellulaceae bacterium]